MITKVRVKVLNLEEAQRKKKEEEASKNSKLASQLAKRKE